MCMKLLTEMCVAVFNIIMEDSINLNINNKKMLKLIAVSPMRWSTAIIENDVKEKYLIRPGKFMKNQIIRKHYIMAPFNNNYIYS